MWTIEIVVNLSIAENTAAHRDLLLLVPVFSVFQLEKSGC